MILLKNIEGYIFHCSECGKEIKKYPFQHEGRIFGSECMKGGFKKQAKKTISLKKLFEKRKEEDPIKYANYYEAYNCKDYDELFAICEREGCVF